jgi:hypothetical protein
MARDKARQHDLVRQRCRCGAGAPATVDQDGDLICSTCGKFVRHVSAPIPGFDAAARMMVTDADGRLICPSPKRRRRPEPWRVTQPDAEPVLHGSGPLGHSHMTPFSMAFAA